MAHFGDAGVLVVRHVDGEDEEQQQGGQGIAGDLHELVEGEGKSAYDEGGTDHIGPFDTTGEEIRHIDQQIAGIEPVEESEDDQYSREDIDRQVRDDMVVFHKLVIFWVNQYRVN